MQECLLEMVGGSSKPSGQMSVQRHQGLSIHSDNLNTFSRILQNVYLTYIAVNKQGLTTPRQMSVPFFLSQEVDASYGSSNRCVTKINTKYFHNFVCALKIIQ